MDETKPVVKDEKCSGACSHDKSWHVVRLIGSTELACCKVDCKCMNFVPKKLPTA